jgi:hypothetical protein
VNSRLIFGVCGGNTGTQTSGSCTSTVTLATNFKRFNYLSISVLVLVFGLGPDLGRSYGRNTNVDVYPQVVSPLRSVFAHESYGSKGDPLYHVSYNCIEKGVDIHPLVFLLIR